MKKLTCRDLGGVCDTIISGNTFAEIGEKCHAHVAEEIEKGDKAHLEGMEKMSALKAEEVNSLMSSWEEKFNNAPLETEEGSTQ